MVTGTLRLVLWVLGGVAVVWLVLALAMLPAMGRMMGEGGMMMGGTMNGGMMGMGSMMTMMGMMAAQFVGMLGLVGIFVYLVVDSFRRRPSPRQL
jgi:uncharacterized membrane protein